MQKLITPTDDNMSEYIRRIRAAVGSELILLPSVAASILNERGELLLQQKAGGEGWSLPAGGIEPGESPEEALRREVLEETGLSVENARLLGAFGGSAFRYTYPNGDRVEYTVLLFRCAARGGTQTNLDPETVNLRYFSYADIPALALPYPKDLLFGG